MSKSQNNSTGHLRLLGSASLIALAVTFATASVAHADGTAAASKTAKSDKAQSEIQVAQNTPPAPPADAQKPQNVEKVTVTGFRGSLRSALDKKKNSNTQIDAIKAEDIAKFPDLNLSEAVQRIPGVSISRDAGEGRQVTVRGLGPQFT